MFSFLANSLRLNLGWVVVDVSQHHGANPARCLVVHDVVPPPAASGAFENENDKFEFHIDCEVVGKDANGDPVSGV